MMKIPPTKPMDNSKPLTRSFEPKAYYQYHCKVGHDTKKCYKQNHVIQDLVDSHTIVVDGVKNEVNKPMVPPNQNQ